MLLKIPSQLIFFFGILLTSLIKTKFDIVHIQGHMPLFFLFIPFLKIRSKSICWTVHDIKLRPAHRGVIGKLEILYLNAVTQPNILASYSDAIIVHGKTLKKELSSKGIDETKIHVIPHFDYRYLERIDCEKKIDSALFRDYLLLFGRIVPYKGINVLINALTIVRKITKQKFKILIAGRGDPSYLKELLKNEDDFIYTCNKFVPSSRIPELFKKSKFLILPYTDASQSGIIPLAYTFSKPVIVSDVGALHEYVIHGKTGFIFEAGNSTQLANYIVELIEDIDKYNEMSKNAQQMLFQEMSLEKCCEAIDRIYDELIK